MRRTISFLSLAILLVAGPVGAEGSPQPVKLDRDQLAGEAFTSRTAIAREEQSERGAFRTEDYVAFMASDRKMEGGVYRAGPNRYSFTEPYGVDEFMYFLEGGVTLTSDRSGEAVIIPREWKGVWDTQGYTKIYVIYSHEELED
jgi:uncharacterized cupin superfamily protein